MSYILDALKRSDRSRQINTTHEMSYSHLNADNSKQNFWLKVAIAVLSLITLAVLIYSFFVKGDRQVATSTEIPTIATIEKPVSTIAPNSVSSKTVNTIANVGSENLVVDQQPENLDVKAVSSEPEVENSSIPETGSNQREPSVVTERTTAPSRSSLSDLTASNTVQIIPDDSIQGSPLSSASTSAISKPVVAASSTDFSSYENYNMIKSSYGLPDMHLDILLHHPEIKQRKAYINMSLYREGDTTSDGAKIVEIGKEGVLMTYSSHDFVLTAK